MSFVIQLVVGRSLKLTQVKTDILRIGRGTNADIRSENPAVAFEHAIIEKDEGGYSIVDKGSITGTYVNRKPVESQRLAKGDAIEVGDLHIEVQVADSGKPLFLKLVMKRPQLASDAPMDIGEDTGTRYQAEAGVGSVTAKKVDYVNAYALRRPYLTKMTVASILLIVALGVVGEVITPEKQAVFMPGGVSGAHSRAKDAAGKNIAEQCSACHTPWKSITDDKCGACHLMASHSTQEKAAPACYSCHSEHRGLARLAAIPDARCNDCHRDLNDHVKTDAAQLANMRFAAGRYTYADIRKINGFGGDHPDFKFPKDPDNLKFNHKLHLAPQGVLNAQGRREVLGCNYCHVLAEKNGKWDPAPVKFENHCQQCHKLTFDPRYPRAEAPHGGDPGLVYGYILSVYAGGGAEAITDLSDRRRILRFKTDANADNRGLLAAEQVIKTKCQKCHDVVRRDNRLVVDPPQILVDWFANAEYTHTSHRNIACEKCHGAARASVPTSDVLMPKLADCTDCHGAKSAAAGVKQTASSCVACHDYHQRTKSLKPGVVAAGIVGGGAAGAMLDPLAGGRMLQTILIAAIVVLLFVVFIPLGAALYQRMKAPRVAAPRAAAPPAKAAPAAAPPNMAPSAPAEPPMRAAAPRQAPSEAAPTQMINLEELKPKKPEVSPTGTEMVQWYGMLRCTSGPLEGQNFIIEEGGFYIGRDSTMSKVVINDGRVSKRHVRVQPRNGKVFVIDEGSTNGTFLTAGGERITEHQLKRGDNIILADNAATFVYQI